MCAFSMCACLCVYTCVHIFRHTHMQKFITGMFVCVYACMFACMYLRRFVFCICMPKHSEAVEVQLVRDDQNLCHGSGVVRWVWVCVCACVSVFGLWESWGFMWWFFIALVCIALVCIKHGYEGSFISNCPDLAWLCQFFRAANRRVSSSASPSSSLVVGFRVLVWLRFLWTSHLFYVLCFRSSLVLGDSPLLLSFRVSGKQSLIWEFWDFCSHWVRFGFGVSAKDSQYSEICYS